MKRMFTGVSMMVRPNRTARRLLFSFSIVLVLAKTASAQMAGFNVNSDVDFVPLTATYNTVGDTTGCPVASVGKFSFKALLTNKPSGPGMPGVAVHVVTLTNGNVLLDPQTNTVLGAEGAVMQIPKVGQYADGLLSPGESVEVPFVLCLKTFQPFQFFVDVFGIVTEALGVNVTGTSHGCACRAARLSGDGRFVAFQSFSNDLVPNDTNPGPDVFVRDLQTQTTTLVSVNRAGTGSGNGPSGGQDTIAISAYGRFVAFQSSASDLVANDTNGTDDVFVRDLQTGATTLVSVNKTGTSSGNGSSGLDGTIAISADGRFIAFSSVASDLVANDTNDARDVFVRDLKTGTTTLVSVNKTGTASGNGPSPGSSFPSVGFSVGIPIAITPDGRFVAFNSSASDLVATDTNGVPDVFVRDLQTQTTTLVSVNFAGTDSGSGRSFDASITRNGRFVAFTSMANDLVARDRNNSDDVFVRDLLMQTTTLVSVNRAGTDSGSEASADGTITPDGRFVLFSSFADDLVATDTNREQDAFVRDLQTQTTTLVSINLAGTDSGRGGGPFGSGSFGDSISSDGRFVSFTSFAGDLVPVDTNNESDGFVRDLLTKTTTLVSINWEGTDSVFVDTGMLMQSASGGTLSSDGHFVVFGSSANLVNTSGGGDLYIRPVR